LTTTATTVSGLISEINEDGIPGVTASFTTAAAVGDAAVAGGDTGILLTNTNGNITITADNASVNDISTGATTSNYNSKSATTTISYVTATGGDTTADLSNTNLTTAGNAQNAESVLNAAITYVAAQDGYIGAQINTLNSISQVMSTQQENVVSAQNAIQATDYASATSNMSKYEILSQTGIAALAQANSVQQEVTKLLQ
jgi:flagellin